MVLLVVLICVGDLRKLINIRYRGCVGGFNFVFPVQAVSCNRMQEVPVSLSFFWFPRLGSASRFPSVLHLPNIPAMCKLYDIVVLNRFG